MDECDIPSSTETALETSETQDEGKRKRGSPTWEPGLSLVVLMSLDDSNKCPVCYQPFSYPAKLPCGHVFCYLCVKGFASSRNGRRCALCRTALPADYVKKPDIVAACDDGDDENGDDVGCWYYEGRSGGWWKYDERSATEIEAQFKKGEKSQIEILIVGHIYVIDFDLMVQYRKNDPATRKRKIKRDKKDIEDAKGVAGLFSKKSKEDKLVSVAATDV